MKFNHLLGYITNYFTEKLVECSPLLPAVRHGIAVAWDERRRKQFSQTTQSREKKWWSRKCSLQSIIEWNLIFHFQNLVKKQLYLTSGNRLYGNRSTLMWAGTGDILTREINWQVGEPSRVHGSTQEECLIWVLTLNETLLIHEWNDLSCTDRRYSFICESKSLRHSADILKTNN